MAGAPIIRTGFSGVPALPVDTSFQPSFSGQTPHAPNAPQTTVTHPPGTIWRQPPLVVARPQLPPWPGNTYSRSAVSLLEETASSAQKQQATIAGAGVVLPLVFGTRRVGGKVFAKGMSGNNLVLGIAWCCGPVDGVLSVEVNDKAPESGVQFVGPSYTLNTHYTGTAGQEISGTLQAAISGYADTMPGVCYSVAVISPGANAGFPRFAANIKGIKLPLTSGGTPTYTENPAYLLAALIESPVLDTSGEIEVVFPGLGKTVDWDSVADVASACDSMVGSPAEKKHVLNLSLDSAQEIKSWIETVRDYAGCFVVPDGSGFRLVPDKVETSVMSFDMTNIVDKSFRFRLKSSRALPTSVEVTYTDTSESPWRDRTIPPLRAVGVDEGLIPLRPTRIPKPGITRYSEAYRYAVERLNDYTTSNMEAQFQAFDEALKLQGGEVIDVMYTPKGITSADGLSGKLFRVVGQPQPVSPGRWAINVAEYDPAKYSSVVVSGPTYPDTTLDDPSNPPTPTLLAQPNGVAEDVYQVRSGGAWMSRLRVRWNEPTYSLIDSYQIAILQAEQIIEVGVVPKGTLEFVSKPVEENIEYLVQLYVVSSTGVLSATPAERAFTPAGKTARPSNVPTFSAYSMAGVVYMQWGAATDLDLTGYEIRYNYVGSGWSGSFLIDRVAAPSLSYSTRMMPAGDWDLMIKALDSVRTADEPQGQLSLLERTFTITVDIDPNAYVAADGDIVSATLTNMVWVPSMYSWVTCLGDTWNDLFPNAMSTYTNALFTYHTSGASEWLGDPIDAGSVITANWVVTPSYVNLSGTADVVLETSEDDITYTPQPGLSAIVSARYARCRISTTGTETVMVVA